MLVNDNKRNGMKCQLGVHASCRRAQDAVGLQDLNRALAAKALAKPSQASQTKPSQFTSFYPSPNPTTEETVVM